jgi:uncharacterized glyoxalase superfamily protein PhnB
MTTTITSYYPVLGVTDVAAARDYYQRLFGFVPRYDSDWYVHLTHRDRDDVHLALVAADHDTIPAGHRHPARGLLLNLEVDDVDGEYQRLVAAGAEIALPLRSEAFGQRHFIVVGPGGVLIDVIRPIPPAPEYQRYFLPDDGRA